MAPYQNIPSTLMGAGLVKPKSMANIGDWKYEGPLPIVQRLVWAQSAFATNRVNHVVQGGIGRSRASERGIGKSHPSAFCRTARVATQTGMRRFRSKGAARRNGSGCIRESGRLMRAGPADVTEWLVVTPFITMLAFILPLVLGERSTRRRGPCQFPRGGVACPGS